MHITLCPGVSWFNQCINFSATIVLEKDKLTKTHVEIEARETDPIITANRKVKTGVAGWTAAA